VGSLTRGYEMFKQMMEHYGSNISGIRGTLVSRDKSVNNKNLGVINELTSKNIPL
jgi:hypothetical protein